jgi:endonuclease/exonuclease/phosphatase family metal-dependent hydrolase
LQTDRRLDYIFASAPARDGRGLVHSCRVVLDEGDADGVFPSDHFGVFAELQLLPL